MSSKTRGCIRTGQVTEGRSRGGALCICAWTQPFSILPNIGLNDKESLMPSIYHHKVACSSPGYS